MLSRSTFSHRLRMQILDWLDQPKYTAADFECFGENSFIDSGVHISNPGTVSIAKNSAVYRGSTILTGPGVFRMGANSHLAGNVYINALQAGVYIGDGVAIGPFCTIVSYSNAVRSGMPIKDGRVSAAVHVGHDVFIGAGVIVLPGVTIEDGSVIGAGAVVNRDVGRGCIVGGIPARSIGTRDGIN